LADEWRNLDDITKTRYEKNANEMNEAYKNKIQEHE